MPIGKVKGGWRWGKKGKIYSSKAGAIRQAQAIKAAGYIEKKTTRKPKRKPPSKKR